MSKRLSADEQETVILFDKAGDMATILTYEKSWQRHLEGRLGLKPTMDNGFGAKEYELPKSRIRPPRAPRRVSESAKKELTERLQRNRAHLCQNLVPVGK